MKKASKRAGKEKEKGKGKGAGAWADGGEASAPTLIEEARSFDVSGAPPGPGLTVFKADSVRRKDGAASHPPLEPGLWVAHLPPT